ncbi:MAG: hypothetical protein JSV17_08480 [Candidatus Aminicenantes bacterium]|nr:MAG: hypothetical protein JSV17_08480 [Candidatus Aminicenantes bacterium]
MDLFAFWRFDQKEQMEVDKKRSLCHFEDKIAAKLSAKAPVFSGQLNSELINKNESEISKSLEEGLSHHTAFEIKEIQETEHTIRLEGTKRKRVAEIRRKFWPYYLDLYIYSLFPILNTKNT